MGPLMRRREETLRPTERMHDIRLFVPLHLVLTGENRHSRWHEMCREHRHWLFAHPQLDVRDDR